MNKHPGITLRRADVISLHAAQDAFFRPAHGGTKEAEVFARDALERMRVFMEKAGQDFPLLELSDLRVDWHDQYKSAVEELTSQGHHHNLESRRRNIDEIRAIALAEPKITYEAMSHTVRVMIYLSRHLRNPKTKFDRLTLYQDIAVLMRALFPRTPGDLFEKTPAKDQISWQPMLLALQSVAKGRWPELGEKAPDDARNLIAAMITAKVPLPVTTYWKAKPRANRGLYALTG
jgi:hypothetical protein